MPKDLRSFLADYEKRHPEEIVHIEKEINWDQENIDQNPGKNA